VHRDLKPANVFLCTSRVVGLSYVVKVLDFGIAKVLAEAKTTRTAAVGTPLYMAPEQYDAGKVTPATDVWALGLIAFELLTGRSYWKAAGSDATPAKIMYETCIGELAPASGRATDLGVHAPLPAGFDAWFARCLERKPEDRFVDAGAAFFMLKEVLGPSAPPTEPLPSTRVRDLPPTRQPTEGMAPATKSMSLEPTSATPVSARKKDDRTELARTEPRKEPSSSRSGALLMATGALVGAVLIGLFGVHMLRAPVPATQPQSSESAPSHSVAATSPSAPFSAPNRFTETGTVSVDGRVLHAKIAPGVRTETYVMLDVRGADRVPSTIAPVHLALVIDRSGSMKGGRLDNAISAAKTAIDRLRDGDEVTVVAFDQKADTVVAPTKLDPKTRTDVIAAVKKIGLGGDTCISCGLNLALEKLGSGTEWTRRILLLSDGEANVGIKDLPGFEAIARDAQKKDVSITTIGVGHDYDPKALTAIARESNGRHYYVESDASLPAVFDSEAKAMVVAASVEATIRLAPGVQLVKMLDRAHRIEGSTIHVPLGQLTRDEHKTILLKVALSPAGVDRAPVCTTEIEFRDLLEPGLAHVRGELALLVGPESEPTDPVVETRVQRSETAAALLQANELFAKGQTKAATAVLSTQSKAIAEQKKKIAAAKPDPANPYLAKDLDSQTVAVGKAESAYKGSSNAPTGGAGAAPATPAPAAAPPAPPPKAAAAKAADDAFKMGY
ncbi:MAG: protein kinase domain-containing protein, partial [Polyangiales bacterium]